MSPANSLASRLPQSLPKFEPQLRVWVIPNLVGSQGGNHSLTYKSELLNLGFQACHRAKPFPLVSLYGVNGLLRGRQFRAVRLGTDTGQVCILQRQSLLGGSWL